MSYFVPCYKICQSWQSYAIFPKFKMAAAHLAFAKMMLLATLSTKDVILHQQTKFDKNLPIHSVEMTLW